MSIPLLELDNRTFEDLVSEIRTLIPRFAPEWTDHNVSDPGITVMELLAWITEGLIYRINRVPADSRVRFFQLLGATFASARPTVLELTVVAKGLSNPFMLKSGTIVNVMTLQGDRTDFETVTDVLFTPQSDSSEVQRKVLASQTKRFIREPLGPSNGEAYQTFELGSLAIVLPEEPYPRRLRVTVDDEHWQYAENLLSAESSAKLFAFSPRLNAVIFGDGTRGRVPSKGASVRATYRYSLSPTKFMRDEALEPRDGGTGRVFPLSQSPLPIDLTLPNYLEPQVYVDGKPWDLKFSILDMEANAPEYVIEPWRNAIRFGNNEHGLIPPQNAPIEISFRATLGSNGVPASDSFALISSEATGEHTVDFDVISCDVIARGGDPTGIEAARNQALEIVKQRWRAVTCEDFEELVLRDTLDIARVHCLPSRDLNIDDFDNRQTSHIGIVTIPQPRYELRQSAGDLQKIYGFTPDGRHMVGSADDQTSLWDMDSGKRMATGLNLPANVSFSPDSRRLLVTDEQQQISLVNTMTGTSLLSRHARSGRLCPDGTRLIIVEADGTAWLYDTYDGAPVANVSLIIRSENDGTNSGRGNMRIDSPIREFAFAPEGKYLATAHNDLHLTVWTVDRGTIITELNHQDLKSEPGALLFTPDGRFLIAADTAPQGEARIWMWHVATKKLMTTMQSGMAVRRLMISPDGSRLAAIDDDNRLQLWSLRTYRVLMPFTQGIQHGELQFSADSQYLSAFGHDNTISFWNARNGRLLDVLSHQSTVRTAVFSPDSQNLTVVTSAPEAYVWQLAPDAEPRPVSTVPQGIVATVDRKGRWLAIANENLLQIWDIVSQRESTILFHARDDDSENGTVFNGQNNDNTHLSAAALNSVGVIPPGPMLYSVRHHHDPAGSEDAVKCAVRVWNAEHVYEAWTLLNQRRLVTTRHHVAGPTYKDVVIEVTVEPVSPPLQDQTGLSRDIGDAIRKFFHPLHGGPHGEGWPLGRSIHASEIYQIVEGVRGVDHVESLSMSMPDQLHEVADDQNEMHLSIPSYSLVNPIVRAVQREMAVNQIEPRQDLSKRG